MNKISNFIYQTISLLISISSFATLAFLFVVNQKGFDITDEGFHLLASQFPNDVEIWTNVAHVYTGIMYHLAGNNVVALRIFSELLMFSSASLLFYGLYRLATLIYWDISKRLSFKIIAWSMICLGALFYYVHFDMTPSYNTLNAIALNTATGLFCMSLASLSVNPIKLVFSLLSSFAAGLFIGIILFVKFPTAAALNLLFAFIILIWPRLLIVSRLLNIVAILAGVAVWILFHIMFLQSWESLSNIIHYGIPTFLAFGLHKPAHCLLHYLPEICQLSTNAFTGFWKIYLSLVVMILACYFVFKNKPYTSSNILSGVFITLFIFAGLNSFALHFYQGGFLNSLSLMNTYTGWVVLLIISSLLAAIYPKNKNPVLTHQLTALSLLLLGLPFAGAVGTANVITLNMTQYMAPWFGFMLLSLLQLTYTFNNRWIFLTGAAIISAFACSQIVSAGYIAPYSLNTTIQYQTVPTAIGVPGTYLKLDKASSDFFNAIYVMAKNNGFKPGDDILAFSDMPGVVFALGGRSPVTPWYLTLPHAKEINLTLLQRAPLVRIKNAYILQTEKGGGGWPDLSKLGIQFPQDYILCGQAVWPLTGEWVKLWKPKQVS